MAEEQLRIEERLEELEDNPPRYCICVDNVVIKRKLKRKCTPWFTMATHW